MPRGARVLRSLVRSPVARFLAIGILTIVVLFFATTYFSQQAADREALSEASTANQILAKSVAKPLLTKGFVNGEAGDIDRLLTGADRLEVKDVERVNIWTADGRLIYTNQRSGDIGRTFGLDPGQSRIMKEGGTGAVLLSEHPEYNNPTDAPAGTVRISTRMSAHGTPVLFEAFYSLDDLEQRREQIYQPFRTITVGALLVLLILVAPIIQVLTRQVSAAGKERERLLQAGLDASDAERRRIARDLHDGVVQDLAGTSFSLAALERDPVVPERVQGSMRSANQALRDALKSLRALLAEIHPPEIQADGLAAALADLTAPAAAQGLQASVSVEGAETATDEQASLVLRVAQEAVRNALRHSRASTLAVTVRSDGRLLVLEVVDDGVGFATDAPPPADRYGLKGMNSLVRDRGGRLEVQSALGEGTAVRLEVDIDA